MASEAWTLWHGGGEGQVFFGVCFLPSDFLSPYLSDYTNESLKTNFRFIDPPPKKKQIKNKSHFGAVSPKRLILQLLPQSGV